MKREWGDGVHKPLGGQHRPSDTSDTDVGFKFIIIERLTPIGLIVRSRD